MKEESLVLSQVNKAREALDKITNLPDAVWVRDLATAAYSFAVAKGSDKAALDAVEVKERAERRAGEFLKEGFKSGKISKGGRPKKEKPLPGGEGVPTLSDLDITWHESSRWQRKAAMPDEKFEEHIINAKERVSKTLGDYVGQGGYLSSIGEEYYTPASYIEAARHVMGGIDTDPASSEIANVTVKAKGFFSADDDGLKKEWKGRVFMNPPYGDKTSLFINKLMQELKSGNTTEAVVLVFVSTGAKWFTPLFDGVLCFVSGRVPFKDDKGEDCSPTKDSVFIYFGPNEKRFADEFSKWGNVVKKWEK